MTVCVYDPGVGWNQTSSFSLQQDWDLFLRGPDLCLHSLEVSLQVEPKLALDLESTVVSRERDGKCCPVLCHRVHCISEPWMLFPCKDLDALIC